MTELRTIIYFNNFTNYQLLENTERLPDTSVVKYLKNTGLAHIFLQ